jgi:hypothetical protein
LAANRKKPANDQTVEQRLAAHLKASAARRLAKTGPMPDPATNPTEFHKWMDANAVPVSEAVEDPDFIALKALLKESSRLRYWKPSREGRAWGWVSYLLMCDDRSGREMDTGEVTPRMRFSVRNAILGGTPGASEAPISAALKYFTNTVRVIDPTVTEAQLFWAIRRWRERRRAIEKE